MQTGAQETGRNGPQGTDQDTARRTAAHPRGSAYERGFTQEGRDPFDEIEWELRAAVIGNEHGEVVFEQRDVEIPKFWSQQATNIVVSKYFRGHARHARARAQRQAAHRPRGRHDHRAGRASRSYFATDDDAAGVQRRAEAPARLPEGGVQQPGLVQLRHREGAAVLGLLHQLGARTRWSRSSTLAKTEGMLFKFGSGTGTQPLDASARRRELLAGGGTASGPVSFMKGYDAFAGVIKSGGKTRRAAKMVILNADHPDIVEFINCKVEEEKKAWALIDAGYDGSFTGPAYASVFFQNSNN